MKTLRIILLCAASFATGHLHSRDSAIRRAIEILGSLERPVNYLNAQQAVALVAESVKPPFPWPSSTTFSPGPNHWVNISPASLYEHKATP